MSGLQAPVSWPFLPATRGMHIVRADGVYLTTHDGRQILDAAGGAIVGNVGYGRARVADAVREATFNTGYVVPPWLTPERERLVKRLQSDWLPANLTHIHLASGGSEGVEAAMKIAIQHHAAKGEPLRGKIIGRSISYHGTTIATTAVGGHTARKKGLSAVLPDYPSVPTPYPLRAPAGQPSYYVDVLRAVIEAEGAETIAALLAEPISGASGGAIVPPDDYWPAVRAICDEFGILLIIDEVMTGFGRTGKRFGIEHWPVAPDLLVSGKGLAGGYAPLAGIFASADVAAPIAEAGLNVMFHTFGAHPAACAAADVVLAILSEEHLVQRAAEQGEKLHQKLVAAFSNHPHVAEVRGRGLLQAIEVVENRDNLQQFPIASNVTNKIVAGGLARDVFFYGGGTGDVRDVIVMGPPFIIEDHDLDKMVEVLAASVDEAVLKMG